MHANIRIPILLITQLLIGALALPLHSQPDTASAAATGEILSTVNQGSKDGMKDTLSTSISAPSKAAADSMEKSGPVEKTGDSAEAVKNDSVQKNVFVAPPEKPRQRFHLTLPQLTVPRIVLSSMAVCCTAIGVYFNSQVNKKHTAYVNKFNVSPDNVNDDNWKKVETMESYRDFSYAVAGICVVGLSVSLSF